jgi:hypothetical protein
MVKKKDLQEAKTAIPSPTGTPNGSSDGGDRLMTAEVLWILGMVCIAGVRIFLWSTVLPFFNNVDEEAHFDLVYKYSHGVWPTRGVERPDEQVIELIALYGSPEFNHSPNRFPGGVFPPPLWTHPPDLQRLSLAKSHEYQGWTNYEAASPPLYYLGAGAWYALGRALGLAEGDLLYWVRFLNIGVYALLIALAYWFCRTYFPDRWIMRLGVTLLLAFFPQDVFYSINNDIWSPVLFLAALALLLEWYFREPPAKSLSIAAGLAVAAALLLKYSNIAILGLFFIVFVTQSILWFRAGRLRYNSLHLVLMGGSVAVPIVAWLLRNQLVLGDPFGTEGKIRYLGWRHKSIGELWDHPLFTPSGIGYFWSELMRRFWRGEMTWHGATETSGLADGYFVWSSLLLLACAALARWVAKPNLSKGQRLAELAAWGSVVFSILFLMVLSIQFDFGDCIYPSRREPYFASGRLMAGALVPFFVLYVAGIEALLLRAGKVLGPALGIGITLVMMVLSRAALLPLAWESLYNWWHLP